MWRQVQQVAAAITKRSRGVRSPTGQSSYAGEFLESRIEGTTVLNFLAGEVALVNEKVKQLPSEWTGALQPWGNCALALLEQTVEGVTYTSLYIVAHQGIRKERISMYHPGKKSWYNMTSIFCVLPGLSGSTADWLQQIVGYSDSIAKVRSRIKEYNDKQSSAELRVTTRFVWRVTYEEQFIKRMGLPGKMPPATAAKLSALRQANRMGFIEDLGNDMLPIARIRQDNLYFTQLRKKMGVATALPPEYADLSPSYRAAKWKKEMLGDKAGIPDVTVSTTPPQTQPVAADTGSVIPTTTQAAPVPMDIDQNAVDKRGRDELPGTDASLQNAPKGASLEL